MTELAAYPYTPTPRTCYVLGCARESRYVVQDDDEGQLDACWYHAGYDKDPDTE